MPSETMTAPARPSPDVMRGVIPYIGLDGRAGEAADFYARAFGAADLGRFEDQENPGRFMHVQIEINGGALMLTDCRDPSRPAAPKPEGFHLQLIVDDGRAWWDRAVEAGCAVKVPLEVQFWGDLWGMLEDPFGLLWSVSEPADAA